MSADVLSNCAICTLPLLKDDRLSFEHEGIVHVACRDHTRCDSCRWQDKNCAICKQCVDWDKWDILP